MSPTRSMLGQFSSAMSQRMARRAGLARSCAGTLPTSNVWFGEAGLFKTNSTPAPKARNVIAWAIGPGVTNLRRPRALKARNNHGVLVQPPISRLQRFKLSVTFRSQGVALGFCISRRWRLRTGSFLRLLWVRILLLGSAHIPLNFARQEIMI